ncbi:MAG: M20/M25/M40 family metallo-hydrolase [Anaerolineales bacterium]|nr:M20/M25/M40 family metallo-hydrolase [Anaerolineales bacterium]
MTIDLNLIRSLVEAWGPSGREQGVRALIEGYVSDLADEMRVDTAGNLICRMGRAGEGGKKIMVAAHMDEIGMIISHVDSKGFARFVNVGGLLTNTLHGNRVRHENGMIGVIGLDDGLNFGRITVPPLAEFFIDFSDGSGVPQVQVGDMATLWRTMDVNGTRVIAKSLDDRIGCVVAIQAMRALKGKTVPNELYFVFTTQEEVGIRGARVGAFGIMPDLGIALDVTSCGHLPKQGRGSSARMGGGASIKVFDVGHIVPVSVRDLFIRRAEEGGIPYQLEVLTVGSTDAAAIQVTGGGVPSGTISIPSRFVHTTSETVDVRDVQACVDLLVAVTANPI